MSADEAMLWLIYRGLGNLAQRPRDQKSRLRIWAEREELYKSMEIPYPREKITSAFKLVLVQPQIKKKD